MDELNFIEAVAERDIDLLLLEESHASEAFRTWLAHRTGSKDADQCQFVGAWHSVTHPNLGESDLILILSTPEEKKRAILIEDKIDADPQPEQADRYQRRGRVGTERGFWDEFCTCLVAPERYLQQVRGSERYDFTISYEEVREWYRLTGPDSPRNQYKIRLLDEAIEQNRRGYTAVPHPAVTEMYHRYYDLVQEKSPELRMRRPDSVPAKSDWVRFFPDGLSDEMVLRHKFGFGRVDLEIKGYGDRVEELRAANASLLSDGMDVLQTSKSASICVFVPTVDRFGGFDAQRADVEEALAAALRLLKLAGSVVLPPG